MISRRLKMRGMTLMELLVVIAIVGILTAIAVPSYRRYLVRSGRTEAKIALLQLQTAQEKFYLQNNMYTDQIDKAPSAGLGLSKTSETAKYDIAVTALGAGNQSYTATASPHSGGGQEDDTPCGNFTINERGQRGNSGGDGPEHCWK